MAKTTKSAPKRSAKKKSSSRCWPGYEPVPGKAKHEQGSCRKKAKSKTTPSEKRFRAKRKRQLDTWKRAHPGAPRRAAQHLHAPGKKKAARKTKPSARRGTTARQGSAKKRGARTKATRRRTRTARGA